MSSILPPPKSTRLVTIVAHVDHGKTTLADNLVEHNGIISEKFAGSMRYLDSLEEEQRRGITIRSSAIALKHTYRPTMKIKKSKMKVTSNNNNNQEMVIHLIDSPGHVDFSMEVSSALQICDGALLLVDVVEGMCARTQSILRESYAQKLVPVLVLNKIDRLCTDLGLSVNEAYLRIRSVIESVNAAASAMIRNDRAEAGDGNGEGNDNNIGNHKGSDNGSSAANTATNEHITAAANTATDADNNDDDDDDNDEIINTWTFEPGKGNVVFSSAIYGWGFTIPSLARSLFKSKTITNIKPPIMRQYLFGDFKYDADRGRVLKWKQHQQMDADEDSNATMFAEYGLRPLWQCVEGISMAATSLGMTSMFFTGNAHHHHHDHTNNNGRSSEESSLSKTQPSKSRKGDVKIKATTPGMIDVVFPSIQMGITVPDDIQQQQYQQEEGQGKQLYSSLKTPNTLEEMQHVLNKTNASSEELVLRALLRRHRPLSNAVLDAVCDTCPSPSDASSFIRHDALSLVDYDYGSTNNNSSSSNNDNNSQNNNASDVNEKENGNNDDSGNIEVDNEMEEFRRIQNAVSCCDMSAEAPVVAHCSKFISTSRAHINDNELLSYLDSMDGGENGNLTTGDCSISRNNDQKKDSVIILGVGRVLSGVLRSKDVEYYCFGPKYKKLSPNNRQGGACSLPAARSLRLYLLMGSSYVRVNSVPAGHFCAIHGLEDLQLKTVTLCNSPIGMPLKVTNRGIRPLVKVNVEAKSASDTAILEQGLAKLSLADAAVEVTATAKGERILACLGELHLEQSILDLQNMYCGEKIELRISKQIVEFGESTAWFDNEVADFQQFYNLQSPPLRQTLIPPYCYEDGLSQARNGRSRAVISNKAVAIHVRVVPLARSLYNCLHQRAIVEKCDDDLILMAKALNIQVADSDPDHIFKELLSLVVSVDNKGNAMVQSHGMSNGSCIRGVVSKSGEVYMPPATTKRLEERHEVSNGDTKNTRDITNASENFGEREYLEVRNFISRRDQAVEKSEVDESACRVWSELKGSCTAGFQAGCSSGPLCEEPVRGVLVVLEGAEISLCKENEKDKPSPGGRYSLSKAVSGGMIVASLKTGIRSSLLSRPARLVEGYLRLTLHSSLSGLGPLYAILSKRRGRVISDTMVDGTDLISIDARLPQSESFGLAPELLQKSSGEVTAPELVFSHWEMLDEDPFWIPTSLEEREDYGEIILNGDSSTGVDNTALKYIRMVRDRKGLMVDSNKIIVAAEKQRTLARKK